MLSRTDMRFFVYTPSINRLNYCLNCLGEAVLGQTATPLKKLNRNINEIATRTIWNIRAMVLEEPSIIINTKLGNYNCFHFDYSGGDKVKMNKKLLEFALAFIFIVILATPLVSAKPTSAANNPKSISFVWHSENGAGTPVEGGLKINPPWAIPIDPDSIPPVLSPDTKVTHGISAWTLNPAFSNYIQIGEESASNPPIPIDAETGYEGTLYVQTVVHSPTLTLLNYRVYEKVMWGDDNVNYIEIMCLERASLDLSGPFPVFYASGTFNGHGVIDGQKVQVTGIREGFTDPMIGFVLECSGTIRFAGKA